MTGPTLHVDCTAIARNYALLAARLENGHCGAVVKADAYGLGVKAIAPALHDAGCRDFFVATLEEGITLRGVLAESIIYVFHGARAGEAKEFTRHRLMPILNSPSQIEAWNHAGPCALHVDTGMNRLGLTLAECDKWQVSDKWRLVMSHLACANEAGDAKNNEQLNAFRQVVKCFAGVPASLANSSGIFLGKDYHFDLARPGCSLYGISPDTARTNPMENVVTLSAPVLQYRTAEKTETVGYGATHAVEKGTVLATVELGYADGLLRSLSNKGVGIAAGVRVPVMGRVSMDMVSVDVTAVPEQFRTPDLRIIFIGKELPVDEVAEKAGTIGYEIFTRLGTRVKRIHT